MAMSSINLVVLTGGLTRDVEVKTGKDRNGRDLYTCSFGLGVTKTSREKDGGWKDESMYHNCYYLTSSEKLLPLLTRGTQVLVTGSLNQYVGKDGQPAAKPLALLPRLGLLRGLHEPLGRL